MSPSSRERKSRPKAAPESPAKATDTTIAADLSAYAAVHAVVVELPDDKVRRRIYLSLHSAEKAAVRAGACGHRAEMFLCRLVPVAGDVQ